MFIGHIAVGLGAKKFAPRTSLVLLLAAPMLADILWPPFLLLGWERVRIDPGNTKFTPLDLAYYPWSHSLLMLVVWATAFALFYFASARYRAGAIAIWVGVVSHWVLDWITHRADMPLYPGGPKFGLALWNSIAGTMAVEIAMFAVGTWVYRSATRARDRIGSWLFWAFVVFLLAVYGSDPFGPPPPSVASLAWAGLIATPVLLAWAWWFDRHRIPTDASAV